MAVYSRPRLTGYALAIALFVAGLFWTVTARADSWMPPSGQTYVSADGNARVTITPRALEGALEYFEDMVAEREPAGQAAGSDQTRPTGHLELRDGRNWRSVWHGALVNDVAPVRALVANDGRRMVTFDNWYMTGHGENVVVIYNETGVVVRSFTLSDLLPDYYVAALPHSVSSIQWGGEHRLDEQGDRLILEVAIPFLDLLSFDRSYIELSVNLASGVSQPIEGTAWDAARIAACAHLSALQQWEQSRRAFLRTPLIGPANGDEQAWHDYLREAVARMGEPSSYAEILYALAEEEPDEMGPLFDSAFASGSTTVLRNPAANDYRASVRWVRDALTEVSYGPDDIRSFASPSQENLVEVLAQSVRHVRRGSLAGVQLFIAVGDDHWPRIIQIFEASGAELIQLDPHHPIPQRPDRLTRLIPDADNDSYAFPECQAQAAIGN